MYDTPNATNSRGAANVIGHVLDEYPPYGHGCNRKSVTKFSLAYSSIFVPCVPSKVFSPENHASATGQSIALDRTCFKGAPCHAHMSL